MMLLYDFSADKYVREVVNEGGEDDEIVDSDGEVISLIFCPFHIWFEEMFFCIRS
jgi:hypothetical protein